MRTGSSRGFTLVEIMVAVTIVTLLLTMVYGVVTSVTGASRRIEEDGESYHRARVIFDRIGREIRGAYRVSSNPRTVFTGGETSEGEPFLELSTTSVTPAGGRLGGISLVRYQLQDDTETEDDGKVLLRREAPLLGEEGDPGREYRLATGIETMQWRFFGGGDWQDEWDRGLPEMVELTLTMRIGTGTIPFRTVFDVPMGVNP
jgi:general secretion pathway protein J